VWSRQKSARGMPLEYEMMGEPIDEIPDCRVTWLPSQSRIRMVLSSKILPATSSRRSRRTRVKGLSEGHATRSVADQSRCHNRPDSLQDDRNTPPPVTPSPKKTESDDGEIHLIGREMKCKNNRWGEGRG